MKFRTKPVAIKAVLVTEEWFDGDHPNDLHPVGVIIDPVKRVVFVPSPEGEKCARAGDWIITDASGEMNPCRAYIFDALYERVE